VSLDDGDSGTVLVLALGNPLMGDDGIGVRVVEELRGRELPSGVALADGGTTGLALVGLMEKYQRVIAVDAADMGQPPGCVRKFAPSEVEFRTTGNMQSLHQVGFGEALTLARALGVSPPELTIIGVQPKRTAIGEELSPEVEGAIPECIRLLLDELDASGPELN
jgi:hydrogenase maturation protease